MSAQGIRLFVRNNPHWIKLSPLRIALIGILAIDIHRIHCPKPSAFLYHKTATFIDRDDEQKQAKDLHYMYFILRHAPDIDTILKEIIQYNKQGDFKEIHENLSRYFDRKTSKGCLMVEKENGPDEYIDDLRQDIFERFKNLQESLILK